MPSGGAGTVNDCGPSPVNSVLVPLRSLPHQAETLLEPSDAPEGDVVVRYATATSRVLNTQNVRLIIPPLATARLKRMSALSIPRAAYALQHR